jgi:hypothetical protein
MRAWAWAASFNASLTCLAPDSSWPRVRKEAEKSAVQNAAFAMIFLGAVAIVAATRPIRTGPFDDGGRQIWIGIGGAGAMLIGVMLIAGLTLIGI